MEELSQEEKKITIQKYRNLLKLYTIEGLHEFLVTPKSNVEGEYISFKITIREKATEVGNIHLHMFNDRLELFEFARTSKEHKGVMTDILKLIIIKSIDFNLPLHFEARPHNYYGTMTGDPKKLYAYYNSLGFTKTSDNTSANHIEYITSPERLIQLSKAWIEEWRTKGGRRYKRSTKRRRNGRKSARR
jgi:hypothetical protein